MARRTNITTIPVISDNRNWLKSIGSKGETYDEIVTRLRRLFNDPRIAKAFDETYNFPSPSLSGSVEVIKKKRG